MKNKKKIKMKDKKMNKIKKYSKQIFLGAIILVAIIFRFSPMFWRRDFWYDEAFTGIITRMSWSEMWWMIFHDVHPPLYYYLLKPWAGLFHYSVFGFRSFSVVFGVLSILSIYWIGKKLFSERVGLISAFLMAISPFAIQYSQEARMYALFGFLSLWLTYFFIQALQKSDWKNWLAWGVIGTLFLYTHYLALFTFVIFYLTALGYQLFIRDGEFMKSDSNLTKIKLLFKNLFIGKKFAVAVAIIGLFFILWIPALKQHMSREGLGWVPVVYLSEVPPTLQFFFYGHQPGKILAPIPNEFRNINFSLSHEQAGNLFDGLSLGLIILLMLCVGIWRVWKINKKYQPALFILMSLSFGVLIFLILLSQIGLRFYVARYFMATAVLIYLLLALIISQFKTFWRWFFVIVYILTLMWLKPISYDTSWHDVKNDTILVNSQTTIIADNAFEYATARFHFGEGRVKLYNRGEPNQDLSLWIIVKPTDQITSLDKYLNNPNVIYVGAGDCQWNQYQLKRVKKVGRLQICK